ncbi:MAG: hypothetical protein V7637_2860 [Mycobacteriales bacterium]|jgi:hypothetical protein
MQYKVAGQARLNPLFAIRVQAGLAGVAWRPAGRWWYENGMSATDLASCPVRRGPAVAAAAPGG